MVDRHKDTPDEQLIAQTLAGNGQAFGVLVRRYERQVAATVLGMLGNCTEAEDVGQETFVRFYKALDTFRGESAVGTYITRIAINLSLNELKKRKRRRSFFAFLSSSDDATNEHPELHLPDPTEYAQQYENNEIVLKALQLLDEKLRLVAILRLIEGYSTKETADLLNIPLGTVLSRLSRAQDKLREIVNPKL